MKVQPILLRGQATISCELICGDLARVIEFEESDSTNQGEVIAMLAEKFFLILETLRSHSSSDRPPIVISTSPHIPIKLHIPLNLLRRKKATSEVAN